MVWLGVAKGSQATCLRFQLDYYEQTDCCRQSNRRTLRTRIHKITITWCRFICTCTATLFAPRHLSQTIHDGMDWCIRRRHLRDRSPLLRLLFFLLRGGEHTDGTQLVLTDASSMNSRCTCNLYYLPYFDNLKKCNRIISAVRRFLVVLVPVVIFLLD